MKVKRIRPSVSVTLDPEVKAAIDREAERTGLNRGQMIEALLAPGISQILSGKYDIVWGGHGFQLQARQVRG